MCEESFTMYEFQGKSVEMLYVRCYLKNDVCECSRRETPAKLWYERKARNMGDSE